MKLKKSLLFIFVLLMFQGCNPSNKEESQEKSGGLEVEVSSFILYLEVGNAYNLKEVTLANPIVKLVSANHGSNICGVSSDFVKPKSIVGELPQNTVDWGENVNNNHFLSLLNYNGQITKCPLTNQDLAIYSFEKKTYKVPILGYKDCPLFIEQKKQLKVLNDLKFEKEYIIEIIDCKDNILITNGKIPYVLGLADYNTICLAANAQNCTWKFTKKAISFTSGKKTYISEKEGAEIKFTNSGIEFNGIKVIRKNFIF